MDNITMGAALDDSMYKKILKACSLDIDLESFPAGDSTEIGEKVSSSILVQIHQLEHFLLR